MRTNHLQTFFFAMALAALLSCQSGENEDKSLAGTHPKLEEQLQTDSVQTPVTSNENPDLYQRYRITTEEAEAGSNYNVTEMYRGKLAPPDLSSHAEAQQFSSALNEGLKEGVNFAGKYTVVTVSCGTACQQHFIVDRKNGRVLDKVQSTTGARFSPGSRLFIVNPPDSATNTVECHNCTPAAYVLENGKLIKVRP